MKYYRCYLLTVDDHIAKARILKCADDDEAKQRCREIIAAYPRFAVAEVWDGARRVCRCPDDVVALASERRRRRGERHRPGDSS
jgi:hypothetical protein